MNEILSFDLLWFFKLCMNLGGKNKKGGGSVLFQWYFTVYMPVYD